MCGLEGVLWDVAPSMALVLLAACPSGCPSVVDCRDDLASFAFQAGSLVPVFGARPTLVHVAPPFRRFSD